LSNCTTVGFSKRARFHEVGVYHEMWFFFLVSWGGMRLSESAWYVGHFWPIVPAPDYRWWWVEQSVEWELAGDTEVLGENLPQCHFVHHRSQWPDLGSNPGLRGGKPATNRLSYVTALWNVT
jgi:hypothetical protein